MPTTGRCTPPVSSRVHQNKNEVDGLGGGWYLDIQCTGMIGYGYCEVTSASVASNSLSQFAPTTMSASTCTPTFTRSSIDRNLLKLKEMYRPFEIGSIPSACITINRGKILGSQSNDSFGVPTQNTMIGCFEKKCTDRIKFETIIECLLTSSDYGIGVIASADEVACYRQVLWTPPSGFLER